MSRLTKHYGFTDVELDFIINYDIKYRMGRGGGGNRLIQLRGKKPVIYLDQNWLSEIAKAHLGSKTSIDRSYLLELSHIIEQGVSEDRFVCPSSHFHESESERSAQTFYGSASYR